MANFGEEQGGGGGVSVVSSWPQNGDATIMYVLIIGALLLSFLVLLGLLRLCCQKDTSWSRVAYPVAISNRLFNVSFGTLVYCAYLHDKLHIFWKFLAPLYINIRKINKTKQNKISKKMDDYGYPKI